MNAAEIVEGITTLPEGRAVPPVAPLRAVALVAGVEVATTSITAEIALRKAWRDRRGGGATPLLLLADDPDREGSVLALGVIDANGPIRSVEAGALLDVLERVSSKPRLEAVRELAAELERLDQAGIPGLKLRDLLTLHTVDVRLRHDQERWEGLVKATSRIERGADWRIVLTSLVMSWKGSSIAVTWQGITADPSRWFIQRPTQQTSRDSTRNHALRREC